MKINEDLPIGTLAVFNGSFSDTKTLYIILPTPSGAINDIYHVYDVFNGRKTFHFKSSLIEFSK